jgi:hypothetical protein
VEADLDQREEAGVLTLTRPPRHADRRQRREERRRLGRLDVLSTQLAGLHAIDDLLDASVEVVQRGWIQNAWFRVTAPRGARSVTGPGFRAAEKHPVTGACLVGSVVEAAGGIETVRSMRVQRALDLLWHTLREEPDRPVRWCPGPNLRMMHTMDLTHWNDAPERTKDDVVQLLRATHRTAEVERARCLAERAALSGRSSCASGSASLS